MSDMYFAQTHEWVKVEGDIATIGITDFAVQQLSDLIFLNLPKKDDSLEQNQPMGEIESVKTVVDINSPISGQVIVINEPVLSNLNQVSTEPFGGGWFIKVKITNPDELKNLLTEDAYKKLCESESEGHN